MRVVGFLAVILALGACATASSDGEDQIVTGVDAGASVERADGAPSNPRADAAPRPDGNLSQPPDASVQPQPDAGGGGSCVPGTSLLTNGNMDSGVAPWVEGSGAGFDLITSALPIGLTAHSGTSAAWLGGAPNNLDTLHQDFTTPSGTGALEVSGQIWIGTEELLLPADYLALDLQTTGGAPLEGLKLWSDLDENGGWAQFSFTSSGTYNGQSVRLYFEATTDASFNTNFFIDSVSVTVANCL